MRGNLLIILITVYVKLKCFYHLWCVHWTEIGIISHKLAGWFTEYLHMKTLHNLYSQQTMKNDKLVHTVQFQIENTA